MKKQKLKALLLSVIVAASFAVPPEIRAQGDDFFRGNDISNQTFGASNAGGFLNQTFGATNEGGLTNQTFGATNEGGITNQTFGNNAPLGSGLLVLSLMKRRHAKQMKTII